MNETMDGASPWPTALLIIAFALAGPVLAMAPLGMAPLVIAAALLGAVAERVQAGRWALPSRRAGLLAALFLAWCALTLLWALNPPSGARKLVDIAVIFAAALALLGLAERFSEAQRNRLAAALAGGAILGLLLLGIETSFDFPLYRLIMGSSNPKLVDLLQSKRAVDALPLLVWPAALALGRLGRPWLGALLAVVFLLASFRLTTASSTLAMILSIAVLGLASWRLAPARRLLAIVVAAAFALIVPAAIAAYDAGAANGALLKPLDPAHQHSGGHRLEIWHFAAEKTLDRPLFGHGLNASRYVPNDGAVSAFQPEGKPVMTLHPHDAFLQVWVELGLVGVVLAGAILLTMLGTVRRWRASDARFAYAGYTAGLVIAGLAFGIWQTWWLATLTFSAVACAATAGRTDHA